MQISFLVLLNLSNNIINPLAGPVLVTIRYLSSGRKSTLDLSEIVLYIIMISSYNLMTSMYLILDPSAIILPFHNAPTLFFSTGNTKSREENLQP